MTETFIHCGLTIRIERDEDPENPRTAWDNLCKMMCWHRRYNLGDEKPRHDAGQWWWQQMAAMHNYIPDDISPEHIDRWRNKYYCFLPLYLYDHGGLSISTGPFSCPWDSGQVGWVYITLEKARKEYNLKEWTDIYEPTGLTMYEQCIKVMESEVEVYDQYLTNDVWEYAIEDEDGNTLDSCCGCYGYDYCKSEAKKAAEAIADSIREQEAEDEQLSYERAWQCGDYVI